MLKLNILFLGLVLPTAILAKALTIDCGPCTKIPANTCPGANCFKYTGKGIYFERCTNTATACNSMKPVTTELTPCVYDWDGQACTTGLCFDAHGLSLSQGTSTDCPGEQFDVNVTCGKFETCQSFLKNSVQLIGAPLNIHSKGICLTDLNLHLDCSLQSIEHIVVNKRQCIDDHESFGLPGKCCEKIDHKYQMCTSKTPVLGNVDPTVGLVVWASAKKAAMVLSLIVSGTWLL